VNEVTDGDPAATFCATLVDEWIRVGVSHAVVAPGSRSTPMALALAARTEMSIHVQVDERSAAFMALGIGVATGGPAVVLTTSGTAAVELHPAVVEADLQCVPLLAVTANRPPELQGVGAPQTIDQHDLFGRTVRWCCEPGPPDDAGRHMWRQLARDCVARTVGSPPGPVQLDLAFREPLLGQVGELPPAEPNLSAPNLRFGLLDEQAARLSQLVGGRRVLVVAGARAAADAAEADAVLHLAAAAGWPVLCDHLSGVRRAHPNVITAADSFLRTPVAAELVPDVVIRIGGLVASRVVNDWLAASGAAQVGVDRWGRCPHPGFGWFQELRIDPGEFAADLCEVMDITSPLTAWLADWQSLERAAGAAIAQHRTGEPAVVDAALSATPSGGAFVVSSSMPVRDLEWYADPRPEASVFSNRGANGIDGVMSTAVGVALTGRRTVCVVGDLAFLHDSNALLSLGERPLNLAIVVIDNRGGGIFSFLPQAAALESDRFEQLYGTPHVADLVALATAHGVRAERLGAQPRPGAPGVRDALDDWAARGGAQVIVVESNRADNLAVHQAINAAVALAVAELRAG